MELLIANQEQPAAQSGIHFLRSEHPLFLVVLVGRLHEIPKERMRPDRP
jgi:hypothetical protein